MKRLLMIAASVLAFAGAAQAEAPSLRSLPEAMLGGWCAMAKSRMTMAGQFDLFPQQARQVRWRMDATPGAWLRRDRGRAGDLPVHLHPSD